MSTSAQANSAQANSVQRLISLRTSEGTIVKVDQQIAEMSGVLKDLIGDLREEVVATQAVPLEKITEPILLKIVEWCEHHRNDPPSPENEKEDNYTIREIAPWDREFMKDIEYDLLHEIILAANFLEIKKLLNLSMATLADMIKGKTSQQIRDYFGLVNDFSPAEREEIAKELSWYK